MRPCKSSDVQALMAISNALEQFNIEMTMINAKLKNLKSDLKKYIEENKEEKSDVQTTHGLSADHQ